MPSPESILIADIGSVKTKVGLIDQAGDEYRVIGTGSSLTTIGAQGDDALVGVRHAVEQIQARTNRKLVTREGLLLLPETSTGDGVDAFVAVTSAPPPLRVAIVGLSREVSVNSAARAISGTYARVEATIALDQMGGRWVRVESNGKGKDDNKPTGKLQDPAVIAGETLARADVDVIVLTGGIDGGATTALYEITSLIAAISAARHPAARTQVIFAGNRDARAEISARLGAVATLRVVDNVHPALDQENYAPLQRELEALYEERRIAQDPAYANLAKWLSAPMIPAARAFEYVIRFLSRRYGMGVLGVDIGGTTTTLISARDESFMRVVRPDLGLGRSAAELMTKTGIDRLMSWVPDAAISKEQAQAYWLNRTIHPAQIPATREDWHMCQALARQAMMLAVRDAQMDIAETDLIVLSGGIFSRNSNQGGLVLLTLDALEPYGALTLAADTFGLLPAYGALAAINPSAAANVIAQDGFAPLATVITATSFYREGTVDVRVKMNSPGSGEMSAEIQHGTLELLPIPSGERVTLELRPSPGVNITGGQPKRGALKVEVEGGALGLIVDARGRPIPFPAEEDKRRVKTQEWLWDVGG